MPHGTPTGTGTDPAKVQAYFRARAQGASSTAASRVAGINRKTGDALWRAHVEKRDRKTRRGDKVYGEARAEALAEGLDEAAAHSVGVRARGLNSHGNKATGANFAALVGDLALADPVPRHLLCEEARRALDDFGYFRRRYLGRGRSPWQEEAGQRMVEWLGSGETEFVVLNAPPSAGKSTLFTHDVVCWLICRDRRIRIMLGSRTYGQAIKYSRRVRRTLVSMVPYRPTDRARREDGATDALACLQDDFGRFRPAARGEAFQAGGFTVAQLPGEEVSDKEFTVTAFGFDTDYLGQRPDVAIWDDLVDLKNIRNQEQRDEIRELWDNIAEARVEPPGLLLLQGQRLRHDDLYRHNIDKVAIRIDDDDPDGTTEELGPKYSHVVYPAHDEANCQGNHSRNAPAQGQPGGCLLDPRRLHWGLLRTLETEQPDTYRVVYQQEDLDPTSQLVARHWVQGGVGPDGVLYRGCWDDQRSLWTLPPGLTPPFHCLASVDPSISNWWACLAGDTAVTTARGEMPIRDVSPGEFVLTRAGWRPVTANLARGAKATIDVSLSNGRVLRLTPDHRVLTPSGWVEAGSLAPGAVLVSMQGSAGSAIALSPVDAEVVTGVGMATRAPIRCEAGRPEHVVPVGLRRQMADLDAGRIGRHAQMGKLHALGDGTYVMSPGQAVSKALPVPGVDSSVALVVDVSGPETTPVRRSGAPGIEEGVVDRYPLSLGIEPVSTGHTDLPGLRLDLAAAGAPVHVVSIAAGSITEVFDLSVEGQHEFVAEGVVVHNCQVWIYHPASEAQFLVAIERRRMTAPEFLEQQADGTYTGLLPEFQDRSADMGAPIRHWIVEVNVAQKWLLQYRHAREWATKSGVNFVPHTTGIYKTDAERGVPMVKPLWRTGRIRLPGNAFDSSRRQAELLVKEITRWPHSSTDDQVMAHWQLNHNLARLAPRRTKPRHTQWRPSWLTPREMAGTR